VDHYIDGCLVHADPRTHGVNISSCPRSGLPIYNASKARAGNLKKVEGYAPLLRVRGPNLTPTGFRKKTHTHRRLRIDPNREKSAHRKRGHPKLPLKDPARLCRGDSAGLRGGMSDRHQGVRKGRHKYCDPWERTSQKVTSLPRAIKGGRRAQHTWRIS